MGVNAERGTVTLLELRDLNNFLVDIQGDMNVVGVHGFLTAIMSSPNKPAVDNWLPYVFGLNDKKRWLRMQRPLFTNDDEGKRIVDIIYRMNVGIGIELQSEGPFYPLLSLDNARLPSTEASMDLIKHWCWGYLHAVDANFKEWTHRNDDVIKENIFKMLFPLALLAGTFPFEELFKTLEQPVDKEAEIRYRVVIFPEMVKNIYRFWQGKQYSDVRKNDILERLQKKRIQWRNTHFTPFRKANIINQLRTHYQQGKHHD